MKWTASILAAALLAFTLACGCAPISVHVRYDPKVDFSDYKTFDWIPRPEKDNPAADVVPGFREKVRLTLERLLAERGITPAPEGSQADLHVAFYFHISQHSRAWWVSNWGYPYYPWVGYWGYRWDPWFDPWSPGWVEVVSYDVGTMVVDVVEAKTKRLVWRGWGRGVTDPQAPDQKLLEAVRRIMNRFPPSQEMEGS